MNEATTTAKVDAEGATSQAEGASTETTATTEPGEGATTTTTEGTAATTKSIFAEEEGSEASETEKQEIPEQYEEFKLPEGFQLDGPMLEAFAPLAKESGLSQEAAQKFVDLGTKMVEKVQQDAAQAWEGTIVDWTTQLKADPEVGGAKLKESTGYAVRALKQFGDPETRQYLDSTRLSNHPGLFKMLSRVGRAISEDKLFEGGPAQQPANAAELFFPSMKK